MAQQKDPCSNRAFRYNQFLVIWSSRSRTNSRQVSWLEVHRLPPPSREAKPLSDRRARALAADSLFTVTRSCGNLTRFPFTLPEARMQREAPAVFYSDGDSIAQREGKGKEEGAFGNELLQYNFNYDNLYYLIILN